MTLSAFLFLLAAISFLVYLVLRGIRIRAIKPTLPDVPTSDYFRSLKQQHPEAAEEWQRANDAQYEALQSSYELCRTMKDVEGMKRIKELLDKFTLK